MPGFMRLIASRVPVLRGLIARSVAAPRRPMIGGMQFHVESMKAPIHERVN